MTPNLSTRRIQFYKQHDDGACDIDGAPMDRGWYWVRIRTYEDGSSAGYGKSHGPFRTKREAERDARFHFAYLRLHSPLPR